MSGHTHVMEGMLWLSEVIYMTDYLNKCINANQIEGISTLTGKLYFFDDGLVFKALSVNSVISKPKIYYSDIEDINVRNSLGFIPNGITLRKKDGASFIFIVSKRNDVMSFIKQKVEWQNDRL